MNCKLAAALTCVLVLAITAGVASADHRYRGWRSGPRYYNNYGWSNRNWSTYRYRYQYPTYRYPNYNYSYPRGYLYSTPYYYPNYYPNSYYYGGPGISFYYGY